MMQKEVFDALATYKQEHSVSYPPRWLTEKVGAIEKKVEVILDKIEKTRKK